MSIFKRKRFRVATVIGVGDGGLSGWAVTDNGKFAVFYESLDEAKRICRRANKRGSL